jgi:hypothetical protein
MGMLNGMCALPFNSAVPAPVRDETELKRRFALELMRTPSEPFNAARRVFPGDITEAIFKAQSWPVDPDVQAFIKELTSRQPDDGGILPTKDHLARMLWDLATDTTKKVDTRDRLTAFKLYGELRGFIDKSGAGTNVNITNAISNKVLVVKDFGSDDDWEKKAKAQQAKLISEARSGATDV